MWENTHFEVNKRQGYMGQVNGRQKNNPFPVYRNFMDTATGQLGL